MQANQTLEVTWFKLLNSLKYHSVVLLSNSFYTANSDLSNIMYL